MDEEKKRKEFFMPGRTRCARSRSSAAKFPTNATATPSFIRGSLVLLLKKEKKITKKRTMEDKENESHFAARLWRGVGFSFYFIIFCRLW